MTACIHSYTKQFSQVFNGNPQLDESLSKKLDNLSEVEAFTQSPNHNHSVAEVVSHITEWRKEILRRLADNSSERMLTNESPENWRHLKQLQQTGWQQLYTNFKQSQQQLMNLLESKNDAFLNEQLDNRDLTREYFVAGLLHHDLYHLGQIGLILKWVRQLYPGRIISKSEKK